MNNARQRPFRPLALALLPWLALASAACRQGASGERTAAPVPVTTEQARRQDIPVRVRAVGHVEATTSVTVKSRVGGALEHIGFREGDLVAKGSVLFEIDARPYQAALEAAQARLERDRALAAKAEEDVRRYAELVEKEFVTREQFASAQASARSLEATVRADEAAVAAARLDLEYCTIRSPLDGRTGELLVHEGNLVKANDQALVVVLQVRPVRVVFAVPEKHLDALRAAMREGRLPVQASPPDGSDPAEGELDFLDNAVDPATGTLRLKAVFPNADGRLWPGQFVDAAVQVAVRRGAVVIPSGAVAAGQDGEYVFVVRPDGTAEHRAVRTAETLDGLVIVEEGVAEGETVVTDGQLRVVPGAPVKAVEGTPRP